MRFINIGFGNLVSAGRLMAVVGPESAPIKRIVQDAKEQGKLIDASYGRRTRSVLMMDNGSVILSALTPEILNARINAKAGEEPEEEMDDEE